MISINPVLLLKLIPTSFDIHFSHCVQPNTNQDLLIDITSISAPMLNRVLNRFVSPKVIDHIGTVVYHNALRASAVLADFVWDQIPKVNFES